MISKGDIMSHTEYKEKHSKRLFYENVKIKKQAKIAKAFGIEVKEPHRFSKKHATNCGNSNCILCGNPRKTFNERTIQEKRFDQEKINSLLDS